MLGCLLLTEGDRRMKVSLEAGEFHYVEYGDEGAPPMVPGPRMGWSSSTWEQVAPTLAKTRRVIALDLRGHGESVWTPTYSFEQMRDDLLEFADRLGLGKFLLCGHSMGASVSWLFAERSSRSPDRAGHRRRGAAGRGRGLDGPAEAGG